MFDDRGGPSENGGVPQYIEVQAGVQFSLLEEAGQMKVRTQESAAGRHPLLGVETHLVRLNSMPYTAFLPVDPASHAGVNQYGRQLLADYQRMLPHFVVR